MNSVSVQNYETVSGTATANLINNINVSTYNIQVNTAFSGEADTASYINNIMQMNDLSSDTIHSGKNLVIYYYSTEIR